ncbi:MAG: MATE family efflux transporter [Anaeromassilibacillus sp.]
MNLGSGISTIVAQSYGAGEEKKTRKIYMVGTVLMAVVSVLMTVLVVPVGGPLIALFGAGPEAVEIGRGFFQRLASFYVVYGLATATRGYLEGIGDVVYSSVAGIVSLACRIIASYAFAGVFGNTSLLMGGVFVGDSAVVVCCPYALEAGPSAPAGLQCLTDSQAARESQRKGPGWQMETTSSFGEFPDSDI